MKKEQKKSKSEEKNEKKAVEAAEGVVRETESAAAEGAPGTGAADDSGEGQEGMAAVGEGEAAAAAAGRCGESRPAARENSGAQGTLTLTAEMRILLAEAERRGYMRGRNERIEELMAVPPEFSVADAATEQEVEILRGIRRSIWD